MKILLAVSGSISAYKAIDLCREWCKSEHQVKVILTKGAEYFVKKEVFSYLGATEVFGHDDDFKTSQHQQITHIQLAKWCDRFVLAPLSANTLSILAGGMANDLLSSTFLMLEDKIKILYPAMNPDMFTNTIVQRNLQVLRQLNHCQIIKPAQGEMVCGDIGVGKLPAVEDIITQVTSYGLKKTKPRKILITTGATLSPLDPVRYLTNPSSGKTGLLLAQKFLLEGDDVHIIAGAHSLASLNALEPLPGCSLERVTTTREMNEKVLRVFPQCDIYISSAAMCDIEFSTHADKIKKNNLDKSLPIEFAPDILANVLNLKTSQQKVIGFAAETQLDENLIKKWQRKPVDLLIGNLVHNGQIDSQIEAKGFATNEGEYQFLQDHKIEEIGFLSKKNLASEIYDRSRQW